MRKQIQAINEGTKKPVTIDNVINFIVVIFTRMLRSTTHYIKRTEFKDMGDSFNMAYTASVPTENLKHNLLNKIDKKFASQFNFDDVVTWGFGRKDNGIAGDVVNRELTIEVQIKYVKGWNKKPPTDDEELKSMGDTLSKRG